MPRQAPYLQRRGDTYFFRIAVPEDLRPHIGGREVTKTLRTSSKRSAVPMALECAAHVIRTFAELRVAMAEQDEEKLIALVREKRHKIVIDMLNDQHEDALHDQHAQHQRELKQAWLEAENATLRSVVAGLAAQPMPTPTPANPPKIRKCAFKRFIFVIRQQ